MGRLSATRQTSRSAESPLAASLGDFRRAVVKQFGAEVVIQPDAIPDAVPVVPTGSILLDAAMGVGGFPIGRLGELYGEPGTGKSTLALTVIRNAQRQGRPGLYLDHEQSGTLRYAEAIGVNTSDELWVWAQPDSLEQGIGVAEAALKSKLFGAIVFDSLASMVSEAEMRADIGDQLVAPQARAMNVALRRLNPILRESGALVLFVNHVHETIGGMPGRGPQKTTPGGKALKFYASFRVELQRIESIRGPIVGPDGKSVEVLIASKIKATVQKNKLAAPLRVGYFYLTADHGIDETRTVLDLAIAHDVVIRTGAWYTLPFHVDGKDGVRLNGTGLVMEWLLAHPDHLELLTAKVREQIGVAVSGDAEVDEDEDRGEDADE